MNALRSKEEILTLFHTVYRNDNNNLKSVAKELLKHGVSHMEILKITRQELNLSLAEAIHLLEIPDYLG